jgi:photosystem II stability/assembly factor-like uncharacterized protein
MYRMHSFFLALLLISFVWAPATAQRKKATANTLQYDTSLYHGLQYRHLGPFRGGRSAAVAGVPGKPNLFYFGATGGGVWRTKDGGQSWENISDGYFGGSIGAVTVSEYDPNVIYVGGGEKTVRGNVSYGYGMWKSVDAGKSWSAIGLENSRHISRIRIHPQNPDLVYAAVMGDLYKPTQERGVYRSRDGGKSWQRILFANENAGAVDLTFDPTNPRILYATTWRIRRTPYSLESGGEGSDIWKSTDGGDSWKKLSDKKGLPKGPRGIIGIAASPARPDRLWAIIEAADGGVYRSDDGGENWQKLNDDRSLRQRAWYYTRIYADPQDADKVYVLNVAYHISGDGGKTFSSHMSPHSDHHDLWIAPEDPQRMIIADDGGAQVSFDGGENWSTYHNQPTAQFYRVVTDNHFPYRIYVAQQDNSTLRISHRSRGTSIGERDWEETAGGESAHIAPDPTDNDIVYGGSYGGYLTRLNHKTGVEQAINVWPDNPMGHGAEGMKYRFQWNFPIFFSPHQKDLLYTASNHLHATRDGGQSWETISPDLTRNDTTKLGPSGGPITKDNTSVEYYGTIFAATESPYEEGLIWTGSDDGLLHVSRDGGKNWQNVTPAGMPEWMMFNSIEADPFVKGGAYVAGTRYKLGDYQPYLYRTKDYGKTWTRITGGIDGQHFTRVVRADPKRQGLLYAGTESGMYISFDDGASWKPFQMNLPIVPITDLALKNDNLIVATQGRSLWIIDDLTPLHQLTAAVSSSAAHLYQPMPSYRMDGGQNLRNRSAGTNHPGGVMVHFFLKEKPDSAQLVKLDFLEPNGTLIRSFSTTAKDKKVQLPELKAGVNRFVWDMRHEGAKDFEGMVLWWAGLQGPKVPPGDYKVRLTAGDQVQEQDFTILADPRLDASPEDLQAQFDFLKSVRDKVSEAHGAIGDMRTVRKQLQALSSRIADDSSMQDVVKAAKSLDKSMTAVEEALYQTKNRSGQDPLNYPIRLTNKLAHLNSLYSISDSRPPKQAYEFKEEITAAIDAELAKWYRIKEQELKAFNALVRQKQVDAIKLSSPATTPE